ncbi:MAG: hypothetical protein ACXVCP_04700 [Bdellovibrio sp.]
MKLISKFIKILIGIVLTAGLLYIFVANYSVLFSKSVIGEVVGVERVETPFTVVARGTNDLNPKLFSFAVAIRDEKAKEIFTASAEDRQWAVVQKGQCAEAVYLPYPPWELTKKGTYFGARLIRLFDCLKK